jgi:hypothetical protein
MDFIERIFGISLDGGTGSFEALLLLLPVLLLTIFVFARALRRRDEDRY